MNFKNKRRWQIIKQYGLGWTLAFIFLSIVRGEGTRELGSVQFEMWKAILNAFFMGPLFGSISGLAQILMEEHGYKRISFRKLILLRLIFAVAFVITIVLLAFAIHAENISLWQFAFEPGSFAIYFYIISVDIFMVSLRQVNLFLGNNNLWQLLKGNFYTPREEERIFMFLDLQSSTQHAERLGHIRYSKMIQDCFDDLGVVIENESEIYQYVGDEVILIWRLEDGLRNQNCLEAYYGFQNQLIKRKEYYASQYECLPHFKAGLNEGVVTVTEVGKYKKEIAYHGDTINTAARIQSKCNEYKKELLISENLYKRLKTEKFGFEKQDELILKGKQQKVTIYAVCQN
ncbi:MAG: adenylate/guanylate cyclase domain-containing protein [Reichenbachiella sp.]|uniref:adenylate/guanylate cyclase domain-containing protein n=1 Tax=Reichenbachiella sp. TaxID=2184521 RepID=UPI003262DF24